MISKDEKDSIAKKQRFDKEHEEREVKAQSMLKVLE